MSDNEDEAQNPVPKSLNFRVRCRNPECRFGFQAHYEWDESEPETEEEREMGPEKSYRYECYELCPRCGTEFTDEQYKSYYLDPYGNVY